MSWACLGWGSLLWRPGALPRRGAWHTDGPLLPVEFARISADGRLTLIVLPGQPRLRTYWTELCCPGREEAVQALAAREVCGPEHIAWTNPEGGAAQVAPEVVPGVGAWCRQHNLTGVVWTDLPSLFASRAGEPWSPQAAVRYLAHCQGEARRRAEEYIRRAPSQTQTATRRLAEQQLGWLPKALDEGFSSR